MQCHINGTIRLKFHGIINISKKIFVFDVVAMIKDKLIEEEECIFCRRFSE